jgi:hypothetical protein
MTSKYAPGGCGCCDYGCPTLGFNTITWQLEQVDIGFSYSGEWDVDWGSPGTLAGVGSRDRSLSYWYVEGPNTITLAGTTYSYCDYTFLPPQTEYTGIPWNQAVGDDTTSTLWAFNKQCRLATDHGTKFDRQWGTSCDAKLEQTVDNYYELLLNVFEFWFKMRRYVNLSTSAVTYRPFARARLDQVHTVRSQGEEVETIYPGGPTVTTTTTTCRDADCSQLPIDGSGLVESTYWQPAAGSETLDAGTVWPYVPAAEAGGVFYSRGDGLGVGLPGSLAEDSSSPVLSHSVDSFIEHNPFASVPLYGMLFLDLYSFTSYFRKRGGAYGLDHTNVCSPAATAALNSHGVIVTTISDPAWLGTYPAFDVDLSYVNASIEGYARYAPPVWDFSTSL